MMFSIRIHYTLAEYLTFCDTLLRHEVGAKVANNLVFKCVVYPFLVSAFVFKRLSEGECRFSFTERGFERHSKSGSSQLDWCEVGKVVDLPECFLLVGQNKGMAPVPKRCFSAEQIALFEHWTKYKLTQQL